VVLLGSLGADALAAESPEAKVERLANAAVSAYKGADYKRAVELLQQAYEIRQVPALLYNMAKAYDKLGDIDHAADAYRRYANSADADPKLKERAEARVTTLDEARRKKAAATRAVEAPPPPPTQTSEPTPPPPTPAPPPGPSAEEQRARAHEDFLQQRHRARVVTVGLAAGTGALAIVAVALSADALVVEHQYNQATLPAPKGQLRSDGVVRAGVADGFWCAAAVAGAVTGYFVWRSFRHEPSSSSLTLAPLVAPTGAAIVAAGRF
jgi:tetratricopeptide (TPR) repeat protein